MYVPSIRHFLHPRRRGLIIRKEINRISKCKVSLPNCIDGVTGAGNICELWKNHFHKLLNCIHDDDAFHVYVIYSNDMIITVDEIEFAVSQLNKINHVV